MFLTLKRDEQQALKFVIRHLVALGRGEEGLLNRRTVPYRDLVSSPELDQRQRAAAKGLVDRLIKEGLLSADTDPKQELLINVAQEALLRRWPGVWQWLSEDRNFFRMRDRLDANLKLWLSRDRQTDDLLDHRIDLAEAETLVTDFGSSLNETQIDYIQKSLARQKRRRRMRDNIGLAAIAGLAIFAAVAGVERFAESHHKQGEQDIQRNALETQLKKAEEKARLAQQSADLATNERSELQTRLKKAEEKAQLAQQSADLATNQRSALETQLKKAEEKAQLAQQNTDLVTNQRSALETQLKKAQEDAPRARKHADLTAEEPNSGQTQPLNPAQNSESGTSPQPLGSSVQSGRPQED